VKKISFFLKKLLSLKIKFFATVWLICLFLLVSDVFADRVVKVKDGDTVVVAPEGGGSYYTCRLYGIDAPETAKFGKKGQRYGEEATSYLKKLVLGQTVEVTKMGEKTYGRDVCILRKGGLNVNVEMVRAGYAWAYRQYLKRPYASEYSDAEREARERRLGLWHESNPQAPWEFRHKKK
jgi:micrococcal nuclease